MKKLIHVHIFLPIILFASTCAKIAQNQTLDCDNPMIAGIQDEIVLINFDDWKLATKTRNGSNDQIYENIILPTGTLGYLYQGQNNSFNATADLVRQKFSVAYDHSITGFNFSNNAAIKKELEHLAKGKVVAIVPKNYQGTAGNAAYEIYGADTGLLLEKLGKDDGKTDTQGAWEWTLKTHPEIKEPHLQATLYKTSLDVTKAIYESLHA